MKNSITFLSVITWIVCLNSISFLSAQTIKKAAGNYHIYQEKSYDYPDMADIFIQNEEANVHFLRALKKRQASKGWGYGALASTGVAALGFVLLLNGDILSDDNYFEAGLFGVGGVAAALCGVISLASRSSYKKNQKRSIEAFNQAYGIRQPKKNPVELNIVGVSNGIGLQLKF
jgi:hypothetical protein